jgi:hypothetical protein
MTRGMKRTTKIFLIVLGCAIALWVLRGLMVFGFMPGIVLWILFFACLLLAVLSNIR